ncbi:MAG: 2Fe-2S iron-sulfur cluster-binding protein, partial [SAR324 cluster bacterium]|nr:2Fe-2S iron-sulfur cluster-binding protein [SAR324 cluster bacterium]
EGLAHSEKHGTDCKPHPLQTAFAQQGASQCGYCSPGMLMTAKALLDKYSNPDRERIREAISGNICRCTGYAKIIEAVEQAAKSNTKLPQHT